MSSAEWIALTVSFESTRPTINVRLVLIPSSMPFSVNVPSHSADRQVGRTLEISLSKAPLADPQEGMMKKALEILEKDAFKM